MSSPFAMMRKRSAVKLLLLLLIPLFFILHTRDIVPLFPKARPSSIRCVDGSTVRCDHESRAPKNKNLVAQNEGLSNGPWIIDPPLPSHFEAGKLHTITIKCVWNPDDLCPKRYSIFLRGPTIFTPPLSAIVQDPEDLSIVNVTVRVDDPGHYELFAWPDFEECPHYWKENMKYPINRGQVMGTPAKITVSGRTTRTESSAACKPGDHLPSDDLLQAPDGRWIAKDSLTATASRESWAQSFPGDTEWVYQPFGCKRPHYDLAQVASLPSVSHILVMGDSVLRGSFCTQMWPQFSESGIADEACTFINDRDLYHAAPKNISYANGGASLDLSFRFFSETPVDQLNEVPASLASPPSHIVTNVGLWLAAFTIEEYRAITYSYLFRVYELFPQAIVIWRTTTDVVPQIVCFSDKGMTRGAIAAQREAGLAIVNEMREKGMKIHVVDAYAMTSARPDAANDGRHWVIESPEENGWMRQQRPLVDDAEKAAVDATWEIIMSTADTTKELS